MASTAQADGQVAGIAVVDAVEDGAREDADERQTVVDDTAHANDEKISHAVVDIPEDAAVEEPKSQSDNNAHIEREEVVNDVQEPTDNALEPLPGKSEVEEGADRPNEEPVEPPAKADEETTDEQVDTVTAQDAPEVVEVVDQVAPAVVEETPAPSNVHEAAHVVVLPTVADTAAESSTDGTHDGVEEKVRGAPSEKSDPAPPARKKGLFSRGSDKNTYPPKPAADAAVSLPNTLKEPASVSFFTLFRFATPFELFLDAIGVLCAIGAGAAQPAMSLLFGELTNSFVSFGSAVGGTPEQFALAQQQFRQTTAADAMYLAFIAVGMYVTTHGFMVIWSYTGEMGAKRIRERYLQAVLRQDIAYFDTLGAGEVATRIQTNTQLIQRGIADRVPIVVTYLSAFVTGYIIAYIRSWRLALALTSVLPCVAIVTRIVGHFVGKYMRTSLDAIGQSGSLAEEVISTIRTTKAFGIQDVLANLYGQYVRTAYKADIGNQVSQAIMLWWFFFVLWSAYALAFYYGTTLVLDGIGDIGVIVNVFMAVVMGSFSLAQMAPEVQSIAGACTAAAKIFATIDRVPTIDSLSPDGIKPASCEGRITFDDVVFDYPSRPDVKILKGLSIEFEPGKRAALVGASGSGKSTIVNLVERFYDPLDGSVLLDGVDLRELNVRWLRSQIGLVSQEPTLFGTTVRENIGYGLLGTPHENASEEEKFTMITNAAVEANADGFIRNLPEGYETNVGQAGLLMSGGQKQRIAIARAIVSNPRILLLDEATSALDTQSEGVVQNALDRASLGRTTIVVAHRLSTIRDADQIYVMGDGMVLEHGTHDELLDNVDGPYSRLVTAQQLRERQATSPADDEYHDGEAAGLVSILTEDADTIDITKADFAPRPAQSLRLASTRRSMSTDGNRPTDMLDVTAPKTLMPDKDYSLKYLFGRMGNLSKESWRYYAVGSVFAMATGMVYPIFGIVYGGAIQGFQSTGPDLRAAGNHNALLFFIVALVASFCLGFQVLCFGKASALLTSQVRIRSFNALLRQDVTWYDEDGHSTGVLTSSLSENPQQISGLGGATLGAIVQSLTTVVGGSVVALCYGWKLALVGIACVPLVLSAGVIRLYVVEMKDKKNVLAYEESSKLACEVAGAIRTVASLKRETTACAEYSQSLEGPLRNSNRSSIFSTGLYAVSQAMAFAIISLIFWYGSGLVATLEYAVGSFFVTMMSVVFGSITAGSVFARVPDISLAKHGAASTVTLLDSEPLIVSAPEDMPPPPDAKGQIVFEDVYFRYPTRPRVPVLRGVNFVVQPGESVALCGSSGCGKSTTIQLIERFYDPMSGTVRMDGVAIRDMQLAEYRQHVALVSQEPSLYAGTIRFNILLGATKPAEQVTQEELESACRNANILDFILSLPEGFETHVGNKGTALSGGQKQRIAIARALIRNPKVLLLDEATSALDSQSERVVQEALDKASRGRTTIAIAHRLSTIQNCDRIYYMKDGVIAEVGTHDELLKLGGGYCEMVQLQAMHHS